MFLNTADIVKPGDDRYDTAARMFFSTAAPSVVLQPRDPDGVVEAVRFGARRGATIAVRSGGHDPLDHRGQSETVIIDLLHLDSVEILDRSRRLVRVGGGARWGTVASVLDRCGWSLTSGDTADVGVGGLTLGGGIGWMVRRYGLAIDNLIAARVVTADGRILTVSANEHPDLFWAVRGGGGNFGVVVDFDFIAQPISSVRFGSVTYQADDPTLLITRWRDVMRQAPEELSSTLAMPPMTAGEQPTATVLLCYAGEPGRDPSEADRAIRPLLELGTATAVQVSQRRYAEILESAGSRPPVRLVPRNTLVASLDDAVIDKIAWLHDGPTPTAVAVRSLGGAFSRVPPHATAFAHRDAEAMIVAVLMSPPGATSEIEHGLARWSAVAELGTGIYINFQGSATAADLAAAYPPETYRRLAEVKARYDPDNRFAHNHNIEPAGR